MKQADRKAAHEAKTTAEAKEQPKQNRLERRWTAHKQMMFGTVDADDSDSAPTISYQSVESEQRYLSFPLAWHMVWHAGAGDVDDRGRRALYAPPGRRRDAQQHCRRDRRRLLQRAR